MSCSGCCGLVGGKKKQLVYLDVFITGGNFPDKD